LYEHYPNHRVRALKTDPWPQLLMLLGKEGERIMIDLLVDCAIFEPVKAGKDNLYQLCGTPAWELEPVTVEAAKTSGPASKGAGGRAVERRPTEITLARNRMLYARAALNAKGNITFGLRHIHVLNRIPFKGSSQSVEGTQGEGSIPAPNEDEGVVRIMMYIFPRQFGLHNVFTSVVDRRQTAQIFQDYTLREEEIARKFLSRRAAKQIPKRLRGSLPHLIQRFQILHGRCAYAAMLQHYCPVYNITHR
jgi:telomerase reverse transcriptase